MQYFLDALHMMQARCEKLALMTVVVGMAEYYVLQTYCPSIMPCYCEVQSKYTHMSS